MKPQKLQPILYSINLSLFCILFFLFYDFIISFKLIAIAVLLSIPLAISYILSKLIKTPFIVLLNLTNGLLCFCLICGTILGVGHVLEERRYDAEEANLDYSNNPALYLRAIREKAQVYINTKYIDSAIEYEYYYATPLKDSNYSLQKPDIICNIGITVNGNKRDNAHVIKLKFDSALNYSVIFDRKALGDSTEILKKALDSLQSIAH